MSPAMPPPQPCARSRCGGSTRRFSPTTRTRSRPLPTGGGETARETGWRSRRARATSIAANDQSTPSGAHAACRSRVLPPSMKTNIRSCYRPRRAGRGVRADNLPFAFNSIAGGDFVAAVAAGNPSLARQHWPSGTTRLLAELALRAAQQRGLPAGFIQPLSNAAAGGFRLVSHPKTAATDSLQQPAGLQLKAVADRRNADYLEMSSVNPLSFAGRARGARRGDRASCSIPARSGAGQFCPSGITIVPADGAETFSTSRGAVRTKSSRDVAGRVGHPGHRPGAQGARDHGAELVTGGRAEDGRLGLRIRCFDDRGCLLRSPTRCRPKRSGQSTPSWSARSPQMIEIAAALTEV